MERYELPSFGSLRKRADQQVDTGGERYQRRGDREHPEQRAGMHAATQRSCVEHREREQQSKGDARKTERAGREKFAEDEVRKPDRVHQERLQRVAFAFTGRGVVGDVHGSGER